jgi:hypothetical protein
MTAAGRAVCIGFLLLGPVLGAQDYWSDEPEDAYSAESPGFKAGGEVTAGLLVFPGELNDKAGAVDWGSLVSAKLNFDAAAPNAEAVLHFNLSPRTIQNLTETSSNLFWTPMIIDELYLRAFLGPLTLETGLRKLAWGRADIQGPLDVTNPLDYTDLTNVGDTMGRKIARPMIHASLPLGSVSRLEGVFIPNFQGHRYSLDQKDLWYPRAITDNRRDTMIDALVGELAQVDPTGTVAQAVKNGAAGIKLTQADLPETRGLEYAQGGLRFTTTLGPADLGAQYYSGYLFRPAFTIKGADDLLQYLLSGPIPPFTGMPALGPLVRYNRYHQIGVDYTQVLFDFSFRAELAANITGDLAGDDGTVYNPSLAWSAGFDRDLFGFTLFVEADEAIRLLNSKVGSNAALDTEAGVPLTATALTVRVSRTLFQDNLELKFGLLWNIEAGDVYLMPSVSYFMGDLEAILSGGIFTGKDGGELSQYRNNGYIKAVLSYSF